MIYLAEYRTHQSVEELKATEQAQVAKHRLKDNVRKVYGCLVKHSFNNLGACKIKGQTIADELGISRATVTRCIKKLRDLNIIESHADTKGNGIKGANIYAIIFLSHSEPSNEPTKLTQRATHENAVVSTVTHVKHESESLSFKALSNPFVEKNVVNNVNACATDSDLKMQLRAIYSPQSVEGDKAFNELCKIAFGRLKQYMKQYSIPYLQMEQIIIKCMRSLVAKEGVKNEFALYSAMIKRQVEQLFQQPVQAVINAPQALQSKSKEAIPSWFDKRNEPVKVESSTIDFEAEKARILAKLG